MVRIWSGFATGTWNASVIGDGQLRRFQADDRDPPGLAVDHEPAAIGTAAARRKSGVQPGSVVGATSTPPAGMVKP